MTGLGKAKGMDPKMLGLGAVVVLLLAAGCTGPTPTPAAVPAVGVQPGKLTILMPELGNERFDFAFRAGTAGTVTYLKLLHGTLLIAGEQFKPLPGIAREWSLSRDGRTWTFKIREGLKWHDGSDLTAQDVLWTFQHTLGPQAKDYVVVGSAISLSRDFESLELIEPDTIRYTTKGIGNALFGLIMGLHGPEWFGVLPKRNELGDGPQAAAYDRNPIATGPMRLVRHSRGGSMEFERFDDFYYQPKYGFPEDRRMNFQSLVLAAVPEEAARVSAIAAGQADIALASLASKGTVERGGGRLILGEEGAVVDVRLLGCWGEPVYPCHDQRVRQALDYALNKEVMRDQLWGGPEVFQVKGWSIVTPSSSGYTPALDPRPFDPDKARQLLADAGHPGGKGFGPLIVNTWTGSAMPFLVESALVAADFWRRELRLDVEVRVAERAVISERERTGELRGQILWREQRGFPVPADSMLDSHYGNPQRGQRGMHNDPELYRIVREALGVLDPDKNAVNARKLFPQLRELGYQIGIGYANVPWAVGPRVVTWQPESMTPSAAALHTVVLRRD